MERAWTIGQNELAHVSYRKLNTARIIAGGGVSPTKISIWETKSKSVQKERLI
ncbi:hypothetical protein KIN20_035319 [Parelaphostrongylus tenuis]|uniref:Uncharacterized protein n=1 Tax=Parelaphostrongylus tenuis TaxID=148309 RepID=A0AAD5RBK3_PARTN|nr:hypothetical protein KIN20_035319 [Parelaphostrongylus tenuis]